MPNGQAKPLTLLQGHRTKAEKELRSKAEAALTVDEKCKPSAVMKGNKAAKKYYNRIIKILEKIGQNEAIFENVLCRYCVMLAEHDELIKERDEARRMLKDLQDSKDFIPPDIKLLQYTELTGIIAMCDKALTKKRDQLLAIERENLMTIQGKLRAIPKQPEKQELSGMAAYFANRRESG